MKPERTKEEILSEVLKESLPPGKNIVLTYVETRWIYAAMEEYRSQSSPVESKWVYGINGGCRYEGGGVWGSLYATEELVRARFNELLQEKKEEYRGMCEHFGREYEFKWQKQESGSFIEYWSNGVDYLAIDRMEVLTELPPIEETKEK